MSWASESVRRPIFLELSATDGEPSWCSVGHYISMSKVISFIVGNGGGTALALLAHSVLFNSRDGTLASLSRDVIITNSIIVFSSTYANVLVIVPTLAPSFGFKLDLVGS